MDETVQLGLPLVQANQAQKHVTVNEALARLDALAQLVLASRSVAAPPAAAAEGAVYAVPEGAVNAWAGQAGRLALRLNGGWAFVAPRAGWRAWVADEGAAAVHDGAGWAAGLAAVGPHGAGLRFGVAEIGHALGAGEESVTAAVIPSHVLVFGVTARVTEAIAGTLESWQLGNPGAPDRYGAGLGTGLGSWAKGMLGQPMAFYAPTPLLLTAAGGVFAGGAVRLAVHYAELTLPGL